MYNRFLEDELYHHGIKGQKWGVRRFQNPDGTLTAEGKKRYSGSDTDKDNIPIDSMKKQLKTLVKPGYDNKYGKDADEAAKLGLRALNKLGYYENFDPQNKNDREWFIVEDQTIGGYEIANLVNKGVTKVQVKELVKSITDIYNNSSNSYDPIKDKDLKESQKDFFYAICYNSFGYDNKLNEFIDACYEVKEDKKINK